MSGLRLKNSNREFEYNGLMIKTLSISLFLIWAFLVSTVQADDSLFFPPVNYGAGFNPYSAFTADLDGDDDIDLAVTLYSRVAIILNNGDGTFQRPVNYVAGNLPSTIFGGDFDADGDVDLVTTNLVNDYISVLLNNGNATFQPAVIYPVGSMPTAVAVADFDGDNDSDLAVANLNSNSFSYLENNGDGSFQTGLTYGLPGVPQMIVGDDIDNDNDNDIIAAVGSGISILHNDGSGIFQHFAYIDNPTVYSVLLADFDSDNSKEIAATEANNPGTVVIFKYHSDEDSFRLSNSYAVDNYPNSIVASDLDNDGHDDLVTSNFYSHNISILINNGDGTFQSAHNIAVSSYPTWIAAADFDADSDNDLVVVNSTPYVNIFLNRTINTNAIDAAGNFAKELYLSQNYPNPFNIQTTIQYSLTKSGPVSIDIYDILGRKVTKLAESDQEPGNHQIVWNADRFVSGIYFYKLTAGDYHETRQMLLLK
jgi:hypothetical protein